jgi:hypothetical protein
LDPATAIAQTQKISISAQTCTNKFPNGDSVDDNAGWAKNYYVWTDATSTDPAAVTVWECPLDLPDGKVLKSVTGHYKDTSNGTRWLVDLVRGRFDGTSAVTVTFCQSPLGSTAHYTCTSPTVSETVDNEGFLYKVIVRRNLISSVQDWQVSHFVSVQVEFE